MHTPSKTAAKAQAQFQQALALHQQGQLTQAQALYKQVLQVQHRHVDALRLLGIIAYQLQDFKQALVWLERALALQPQHALIHSTLGLTLAGLQQYDAALASYERAIALDPTDAEIYNNRGMALRDLKQAQAAVDSYERAIALQANYPQAYNNRGNALADLKQYQEALQSYSQAIALKPNYAMAYYNRANVLRDLRHYQEAVHAYDQAIALQPHYPDALTDRGNVLCELEQHTAALHSYNQALAVQPGHARAHWNRSLCWLQLGNFSQGWQEYEWRWQDEQFKGSRRTFEQPAWQGQSLEGKTILLYGEQGLGDSLQFCRYVQRVSALGARIVLEVPRSLVGILRQLEGIDTLLARGEPLPAFDYHCALLSLALVLKTEPNTIPASVPYLRSDPIKVLQWRTRLGPQTQPRVGLVCSGSVLHKGDQNRSVSWAQMLQCLPPGLQYISLQKELRAADQASLSTRTDVLHFGDELHDFTDTAALCELMDVIVSVDTSVVHLVGAMGKPVWVLLPLNPDWRWMLGRTDSPWYPSATLYRQTKSADWQEVLQRIAGDLQSSLLSTSSQNTAAQAQHLFKQGLALHQQGQWELARQQYEHVLRIQPKHFDALHMLGCIAQQTQQSTQAVDFIRQAIAMEPSKSLAYVNLGIALRSLKQYSEALACYDQALALKPRDAQTHMNRGNVLCDLGQYEAAVHSYDQVLALQINEATAHAHRGFALSHLGRHQAALDSYDSAIRLGMCDAQTSNDRGLCLAALGQHQAAVLSYDQAIALKPDDAQAHFNRSISLEKLEQYQAALTSCDRAISLQPGHAPAQGQRGVLLTKLKQYPGALQSLDLAIALDPTLVESHNNRGDVLRYLRQPEAALDSYAKAIALRPDMPEIHNNRGIAWVDLGRYEEAIASYNRAIALKPDYEQAYNNRALALLYLGQYAAAVDSCQQAIALKADYASAHWNQSLCYLKTGNFELGWQQYEWRWKDVQAAQARCFTQPTWTGPQTASEKTGSLLVWGEQGLGDQILGLSMLQELEAYAKDLTVAVEPRLVSLVQRSFPHIRTITLGADLEQVACDHQIALLSLGQHLRKSWEDFPSTQRSYLKADAQRSQNLRQKIAAPGLRVCGLSWFSQNPQCLAFKNMALRDLAPLLRLPHMQFIDLQYGDTVDERRAVQSELSVQIRRMDEVDSYQDIDGLAALIDACDVVVTISNTTAHVAGALGKPVYLMLPYANGLHWYWHEGRQDSPWYPTARLYRQTTFGNWAQVVERIRDDLR